MHSTGFVRITLILSAVVLGQSSRYSASGSAPSARSAGYSVLSAQQSVRSEVSIASSAASISARDASTITVAPPAPTSWDIPSNAPVGSIHLIAPWVSATTYYKIGNQVHLAWTFTDLIATPTNLIVQAVCTTNNAIYTITSGVGPKTTSMYWDTGAYNANATVSLLTAQYTLMIYDADVGDTDDPQRGYLAPFETFVFGMYSPQPYTALPTSVCPACSPSSASRLVTTFGLWRIAWLVLGVGLGFLLL